jgi:hypothetical protein
MDKIEEAGKTGALKMPLLSLFPRLPLSLSLNRLSAQQDVPTRGTPAQSSLTEAYAPAAGQPPIASSSGGR